MPWGLTRFQQSGQSHLVTFCCYHRRRLFTTDASRRIFESALERVRRSFRLHVYGYVSHSGWRVLTCVCAKVGKKNSRSLVLTLMFCAPPPLVRTAPLIQVQQIPRSPRNDNRKSIPRSSSRSSSRPDFHTHVHPSQTMTLSSAIL